MLPVRMNGGGIEGGGDGASPLQTESGGDFLFRGKAKLFDPLADFSVACAALGFEGSADFEIGELAASHHEEPQRNAVGRRRRWSHPAQAGELAEESGFQALRPAIEEALEERSFGAVAPAEALPERTRTRAGSQSARELGGFERVALDPVGGPG